MSGTADTREALRATVADAARRLAATGAVIGTAGNVSARSGDEVAVTASGVPMASAGPDDVTVVDLTGAVVAGSLRPSSETPLHLGVYRSTDAGAVVHTHSGSALALSLVADELPVVHYQQLLLGGAVPVVPFATFGSTALAESVTAAMVHRTAAILAHHGSVVRGATLDDAFAAHEMLEWLCSAWLSAAAIGTPRTLSAAQLEEVAAAALATGYGRTHPAS